MQVDYQGWYQGQWIMVECGEYPNENGRTIGTHIFNKKQGSGQGILRMCFGDITYKGYRTPHIVGYDKERTVKNIRFENLKINGVISDDTQGRQARMV